MSVKSEVPIWFGQPSLQTANERGVDVLNGHLATLLTEFGPDYVVGTMPIQERVHQPVGAARWSVGRPCRDAGQLGQGLHA